MNKPIQIRNEQVVSDIRELAALERKAITEVVAEAVHERLEQKRRGKGDRYARINATLARIDALPKVGSPLTDDDLYDESGLPK